MTFYIPLRVAQMYGNEKARQKPIKLLNIHEINKLSTAVNFACNIFFLLQERSTASDRGWDR